MKENNLILEVADMSKTELRDFIKKMLDSEVKKIDKNIEKATMTKEDVKEIVKDMMIKQYKFFWEKKSFWVNNI